MFLPLDFTGPVHFIGIGGIGMSGLAEILRSYGISVQGSDKSESGNTLRLRASGIPVFLGHASHQIDHTKLVIYSSDIKPDNIELSEARARNLPILSRGQLLAQLVHLKPSIVAAGSHGKTTTSSLVAHILENANLDPTVITGGIITAHGTNAKHGQGKWVVVESDESDGSFTLLRPTVGIVTNIDPEHMDHYHSLEDLHRGFKNFLTGVPFYGKAVVCVDHPVVAQFTRDLHTVPFLTYGLGAEAHVRGIHLRVEENGTQRIDVTINGDLLFKDLLIPLVGIHNVLNTLAAIGATLAIHIPPNQICQGISSFQGVKRRFTKVEELGPYDHALTLYDDYAHHPVEIAACLSGARSLQPDTLIALVEPHRFSRVSAFHKEFAESLELADEVIFLPLYPASENPIPEVDSSLIAKNLKRTHQLIEREDLLNTLRTLRQRPGRTVLVGMGAGLVSTLLYTAAIQLAREETSV